MARLKEQARLLALGDSALVIEFPAGIDENTNAAVHALARWIRVHAPVGIIETVPAYHTLTVFYDPCINRFDHLKSLLAEIDFSDCAMEQEARLVVIPVCYDLSLAPDLPALAEHCGVSIEQVIALHTRPSYRVYFLGFKPGFPYLGGLDARLRMPRKASPRISVPAGSVGIGGEQTGVYPQSGPGGWQIIGRTPARLFDIDREPPCLLQAGDRVTFQAITLEEFQARGESTQGESTQGKSTQGKST
jgi:KipI family sensor histidine kinase inhibitor